MFLYVACLLGAYLLGAVPVGIILAAMKGADPRKVGSGNIGATNVMRAAGKKMGILTLIGDILKGFIPTIIALLMRQPQYIVALMGFAAFMGHIFPVYLKFRGGKGVATAVGVYLAISPLAVLINVAIFALVLARWRYVSLGSIVGGCLMPLTLLALGMTKEFVCLALVIGISVLLKHKDNISRLMQGKENKISFWNN